MTLTLPLRTGIGRLTRTLTGSLRTKLIAWFFVPTAIILIAVALVNFNSYQNVTEDLVIERDRDLTRDCPDQTDSSNHVTLWDGSNYKRAA